MGRLGQINFLEVFSWMLEGIGGGGGMEEMFFE